MPIVKSLSATSLMGILPHFWVLTGALVFLAQSSAFALNPASIEQALKKARIQTISPALPAPDFNLPTLAGGEFSLSDNKGRWLLLTFFATWCGPCKTEMPSLQQFHEQFSKRGFDVYGVSTDSAIGIVKPFARSFGLTFPIGVDTEGEAARLYQANSIPVSFLISPNGTVVGAARGARDWSRMGQLVESLLAESPPNAQLPPAYSANATPLTLPSVLNPPSGEIALSKNQITAGETAHLNIKVTWAGHFNDYLLHPPTVGIPDGIETLSVKAQTTSLEGRKVITYVYHLHAPKEGSFALNPIELRYTPRSETEPIVNRLVGPALEVLPYSFMGMSRTLGYSSLMAALMVLACLVVFSVWRLKNLRNKDSHTANPAQDYLALSNQFGLARKLRHQGDIVGFLNQLTSLDEKLAKAHTPALNTCDLINRVQYGGHNVAPQELDQLQRSVELKLRELEPRADEQQRSSLPQKEGENQ